MKKNIIIFTTFAIFTIICCLALLIFCVPNQIPTLLNFNETIAALGSKWLMLIGLSALLVIFVIAILIKNKNLQTFFKSLFFVISFQNIIILAYYSLEKQFEIGLIYKIPTSITIFMPIAFLIIVWANLLKNIPYKSKIGINNKYSLETEFLWTQIHFIAKDKCFAAGCVLTLISLIFSLIRQPIILALLFLLILISTYVLINKEAKEIHKKYLEMKQRKDKLDEKKKQK